MQLIVKNKRFIDFFTNILIYSDTYTYETN